MYELLGICLALSAVLLFNAFASLTAVGLWESIKRFSYGWSATTRANVLFFFRIFPPAIAITCVLTLLIPAYIAHEPRTSTEVVSPALAALAFLSVIGLALALWRGLRTWHVTRRLVADWLRHAEPISLENISIPSYRVNHRFPVVAVVGAIRPRLFIADQVFDTLSEKELQAVVAHELGHLAAHDYLKRVMLRVCRDVLAIIPCGRSLDRAWDETAEAAADEHATRICGAAGALDLADAMIKISRAVPLGIKPTMPAGAFLINEVGGSVVWRVRRLTELATTNNVYLQTPRFLSSLLTWVFFFCPLVAIALIATNAHTSIWMHDAIERIVSVL